MMPKKPRQDTDPHFSESLSLAERHAAAGRFADAEDVYKRLLQIDSANVAALTGRAKVVYDLNDPPKATGLARRAVRAQPDDPELRLFLGNLYLNRKRFAEAEKSFRAGLELDPDNPLLMRRLAVALHSLENFDECELLLRAALEKRPEDVQAWLQLGAVLGEMGGRDDEAGKVLEHVLELEPNTVGATFNLSLLKQRKGEIEEAERLCKKVCEVNPDDENPIFTLAQILLRQDKVEEAEACFRKALDLDPGSAATQVYIGFCRLLQGDFEQGWKQYEWRLRMSAFKDVNYHRPRWSGTRLNGEVVLLLCEQGMGDNIQFIRYAKMVKARGARTVALTSKALCSLAETVPGVDAAIPVAPAPRHFDYYIPVLSLPGLFETDLDTIPNDVPYMHTDPEKIAVWKERMGEGKGLKVGLTWRGNPNLVTNRYRSMNLDDFRPILEVPGVRFFSLQKVLPDRERDFPPNLMDIGTRLGDYGDTAAVMENLDLIISVDTSVAHLAGALGRPVWVLLSTGPDFRWLLKREDSPWYPTARLFRQERLLQWDPVIAKVVEDLTSFAGGVK